LKSRTDTEFFFNHEVIGYSLEGRSVDLYSIGLNDGHEAERKTIFMTSRVHCGETPGSYFLQGVLDMISD